MARSVCGLMRVMRDSYTCFLGGTGQSLLSSWESIRSRTCHEVGNSICSYTQQRSFAGRSRNRKRHSVADAMLKTV
jgi:hypothetical protein